MRPSFTHKKVTPSEISGGKGRGKKILLKAANDNRAPLSFLLKKLSFTLAPIAALAFFAIVWWKS